MRVAVFDKEHRFQGWLKLEDRLANYPSVTMRLKPEGPLPTLADWKPHDVRYNRRDEVDLWPKVEIATLQWVEMCVARSNNGMWTLRGLVVDDVEKLPRITSFKYLAEEYGEFHRVREAASP